MWTSGITWDNHGKSIIYITDSMLIRLVNYVELYSSYFPTGMFINRSGVWTIWIVTGCFESIGHDLFGCVRSTAKLLSTWATWRIHHFVFLEVPGVWNRFHLRGCLVDGGMHKDQWRSMPWWCHDSSFIWILSPKYNQKRVFIILFFPLRHDFVSRNGLLVGILPLFWSFPSRVFVRKKITFLFAAETKIFPSDGFHLGWGV